jgi:hypothetical protein
MIENKCGAQNGCCGHLFIHLNCGPKLFLLCSSSLPFRGIESESAVICNRL